MNAQLDLADRRILFELDCNSRQNLSELSRRVRLGRDLVAYRMEKLQDQGVLKRCSLMINPYKLGLTVYKTYLRLETTKGRVQELIHFLDQHPSTYWLAEATGEWDLVFSILARTPKEFYDFQDRVFSSFRDIILGFNVYTLVNYWWFPKKYLLGNNWQEERLKMRQSESAPPSSQGWGFHTPAFTFGETPNQYLVDEIESKLLSELSRNARLSFAELGERLNVSPTVAKYRLEKLQDLGVVAGFRVDIDRTALGMAMFKVLVHLRDYDAGKEAEFSEFCRTHPHISCYIQQIGSHIIEFEVEASGYEEFNQIVDEVKERFSKYIRSFDFMHVRKDYHHRIPCEALIMAPSAENIKSPSQMHSVAA
jgi:Lrp/AsnC family leucine-responsive transcriptional regulator